MSSRPASLDQASEARLPRDLAMDSSLLERAPRACWRERARGWVLGPLALIGASTLGAAQSDVRAWSADGQVYVVWRIDATAPLTYDIYRSAAPLSSSTQGTLVARLFAPEWSGERLKLVDPAATWRVPNGTGGTYQLAANEGLCVYTPRAAANEHFAVVRDGSTAVSVANRTANAVTTTYDPVNEPVACHLQSSGVTNQGYPYTTWAMWVDGRDDPADGRPDMPVLANAAKNAAPHVFTVFEPRAGLPAGPLPAVVCLHGGGPSGSHWSWAPESVHYANDEAIPVQGVTIAMDDRVYVATNGIVSSDRPSNWFGWHPGMDPLANTTPGANAVVVPYTLRRLMWTIDWLQSRSPYSIDPRRTAVMGNSMGGAGTLLLSRYRPERFSAATAFVPQHYTPDTGQRLFGTPAQNLRTIETSPNGVILRVNDFFDAAVRLSPPQRDFCLTRIFRGRRDSAVDWDPRTIQLYESMNAARHGTHLYWDNRDHTASDWTTDDPTVPGVDIGEWVHPVRTERSSAAYQARFRSDQSYPGFHDDDQQPAAAGRQPTLGNGSPDDGTPWGTFGGYFDWDVGTIFDTPSGWSCTIHLVGRSSRSIDNFPGTTATTSLVLRKPRRLLPSAGTVLSWTLRDDATDAVLQSGVLAVEAQGLVAVTGLAVPKDPARARLEFREEAAARPGDLNADGSIGDADLALMQASPVDLDGDGSADSADVALLERYLRRLEPGTAFCLGDGSATACPCANPSPSSAKAGCRNSLGSGGSLAASGMARLSNDTLALLGAGMPNSSALYFQGNAEVGGGSGATFGDGLRCVGTTVVRLGTKLNAGGTSRYPDSGDQPVSVRGGIQTATTRHYQIWYRNAASFCSPATFNLSNGMTVAWAP